MNRMQLAQTLRQVHAKCSELLKKASELKEGSTEYIKTLQEFDLYMNEAMILKSKGYTI